VRECPQKEQLGVFGLQFREPPMIHGSSVADPISFGVLALKVTRIDALSRLV
jgi:hypothetical protein